MKLSRYNMEAGSSGERRRRVVVTVSDVSANNNDSEVDYKIPDNNSTAGSGFIKPLKKINK